MTRILYIDLIKCIAIISVISNHFLFLYDSLGTNNILYTLNSIFSFIGVPLFLICSGSLVLKKNLSSKKEIIKFYKHNLLTIFITAEIWIIIYYIFNCEFNTYTLIKNILLISKPSNHLWYIRMILLYYAIMPIIYYLINKKKFLFFILLLIICTITFIYNGYKIILHDMYPTTSGLSYSCYLVYLAIGYYISNDYLNKIKNYIWTIIGIFAFIFIVISHYSYNYFIWYDNPFILILSTSIYINLYHLFLNTSNFKYISNIIINISKMSFGIYLSHMLIILLISGYLRDLSKYININLLYYTGIIIIFLLTLKTISFIKYNLKRLCYIMFRY